MEAGIAVVLGSMLALIPAAVVAALLVVRSHLEDRALRRELPGYEAYALNVRYRLIPHLW
jgi:protein-S-isoprenylcysteine O-methyltransferase Ste14